MFPSERSRTEETTISNVLTGRLDETINTKKSREFGHYYTEGRRDCKHARTSRTMLPLFAGGPEIPRPQTCISVRHFLFRFPRFSSIPHLVLLLISLCSAAFRDAPVERRQRATKKCGRSTHLQDGTDVGFTPGGPRYPKSLTVPRCFNLRLIPARKRSHFLGPPLEKVAAFLLLRLVISQRRVVVAGNKNGIRRRIAQRWSFTPGQPRYTKASRHR